MSDFYYFISSLPTLRLEQMAKASFADFVERCKAYLDKEEVAVVASLTLMPSKSVVKKEGDVLAILASLTPFSQTDSSKAGVPVLADWFEFETELRNAAIRHRLKTSRNSCRENRDWQRPSAGAYLWVETAVEKALGADGAYEQERAIQRIRWNFLDQLGSSHFFDFSTVVIYGLKLLILEQLGAYDAIRGQVFFEEQLKNVVSNAGKMEL